MRSCSTVTGKQEQYVNTTLLTLPNYSKLSGRVFADTPTFFTHFEHTNTCFLKAFVHICLV